MSKLSSYSRRASLMMATVSVIGLCASAHAYAQTAAPAATDGGEVLVTASRRSEHAKDVPVSLTSISGEKLGVLNSGGQDIRLLSGRTPSLVVESSFGRTFPRFYIRGLGNTDFDVNSPQPVSVVYDDVALESPMLKAFPIFDLADVEVLRGPQGTLFGRNTPAGVVKLDSAKPSDTFGGYVSGTLGSFGQKNFEGAVTDSLGGGFSFRLSGMEQHRDDWVNNVSTVNTLAKKKLEGYTDRAARLQIAYKHDNFDALLNIHGRSLDGTPRVFRAGLFKKGSNDFNDGFDVKTVSLDGVTSQTLSSEGIDLHLNWTFDNLGTLRSITGYETAKVESSGDIDGGDVYDDSLALNHAASGIGFDSTGGISKPEELSQELRFEFNPWGAFRGQLGAYYFDQKLYYSELSYDTTGAANSDLEHHDTDKNWGAFASGEFKATDALTIRAGVRYSNDKKHSLVDGLAACGGFCTTIPLPATASLKGDNVSGDLSATYTVTPNFNWYARAATGYQAPAIQDRVNFIFDFTGLQTAKAETVDSVETGFKSAFFDHKLSLDADVYAYGVKNMQLTSVGGAGNSAHLVNAKKVDAYGLEFDLTAKPIDNLVLTAGGSYNHTEIKDPNLTVGACGSDCTMIDTVDGGGRALIDGNPLPQAPKYVLNMTARYAWPLGNGAQIFAYTDWFYRSEINYFLYEAKEFTGRPETIGGLRLGYLTSGGTEYAVFVRNITNQIRAESAIDFDNLTGMVNDPRTFGVSIRKSF